MKVCLNVNADTISVIALNRGNIAVEVDGVELAELIDAVNTNDCTLHIADEPGHVHVVSPLPPTAILRGIQCSTAHITKEDIGDVSYAPLKLVFYRCFSLAKTA